MWLSRRIVEEKPEEETAVIGSVTIGGLDTAVVTDAEKRNAKMIAPGGYCWAPSVNDTVLVLKGSEAYIPGKLMRGGGLSANEVMIYSQQSRIILRNNGKIEIEGDVYIDGDLYVNDQKMEVP